jgi:diguanylate cyclase (GGDEF)-like protein/PAS domain S-box-containing protein
MKDMQKKISFSATAALSLWTADAAIDAFFFHQGTFTDLLLFNVSLHEVVSRLLIIAGFILYFVVFTKMRSRGERMDSEVKSRRLNEEPENQVAERTAKVNAVNELLHKEIRDRARTEEDLHQSELFFRTIFDSFYDPFSIVDRDYTIVKFNDAFASMRDKLPEDLMNKKCYEVLWKRNRVCEDCVVEKTFHSKDPCAKEKKLTLSGGSEVWIEIYTYPVFDRQKSVSHVIQYARDISDRKRGEEEKKLLIRKLNHLSTTDGLTGLLNRRALSDMLLYEIDRAQRYYSDLALILCDVDDFKNINDTYGHASGDRALQVIAECLSGCLRKADILGRYGGDEFMVILPETAHEGAKSLAEKIRKSVSEINCVLPDKGPITLTLSVGVASCCTPNDNIDSFVMLADTALYSSKRGGKNMVSSVTS